LEWCRTPGELWLAHALGLAVLALFTLGVFARVTSVLALVVVLSYVHRGWPLAGLFEPILAMALFYVCLGPSGACLSVDRWRAERAAARAGADRMDAPRASAAANVALRLLQLHLAAVYLMMALGKLSMPNAVWWVGHAAFWLSARSEPALLPELGWEPGYAQNAWTHAIVWFEALFGVLVWNRLARPLLLVLAVPLWASLGLLTGLWPFCMMMLSVHLAFVSGGTLRAVGQRLGRRRTAAAEAAGPAARAAASAPR
jgi:hypothetical protein